MDDKKLLRKDLWKALREKLRESLLSVMPVSLLIIGIVFSLPVSKTTLE